jgi:general L-amino acid transport system substrate-binding protein
MVNKYMAAGVAAAALMGVAGTAHAGKDLDAVKARGQLICGVNTGVAGFALADSQGKWVGLDVDVCRAVAAAIFGDAEKVKYVPTTAQQRFTALQSGEVDILSRTTTITLTRDTALGFDFTGINYYDGQGLWEQEARREERQGTERRHGLRSARHHHRAQPGRLLPRQQDDLQAGRHREGRGSARRLFSGRCDVFTTDARLYSTRAANAPNPDDYIILPEIISKEPLGPAVRHGDNQFADIVRWAFNAMLEAESTASLEERRRC